MLRTPNLQPLSIAGSARRLELLFSARGTGERRVPPGSLHPKPGGAAAAGGIGFHILIPSLSGSTNRSRSAPGAQGRKPGRRGAARPERGHGGKVRALVSHSGPNFRGWRGGGLAFPAFLPVELGGARRRVGPRAAGKGERRLRRHSALEWRVRAEGARRGGKRSAGKLSGPLLGSGRELSCSPAASLRREGAPCDGEGQKRGGGREWGAEGIRGRKDWATVAAGKLSPPCSQPLRKQACVLPDRWFSHAVRLGPTDGQANGLRQGLDFCFV